MKKEVLRMTPLNDLKMDSGCYFRVMAINLLLGMPFEESKRKCHRNS